MFADHTQRRGCLRKMDTVSVAGLDSHSTLSRIISMFSQHAVPVTRLYFLSTSHDGRFITGFGPSALNEIFTYLPLLERLCVDQHDQATVSWCGPGAVQSDSGPGPWVSFTVVPTVATVI